MQEISRRRFLAFLGSSAAASLAPPVLARTGTGGAADAVQRGIAPALRFTPLRLPHPLPLYTEQESFLATAIGAGDLLPASENTQLSSYDIVDDVVVPPEFERYVIVRWGDRVFPDLDDYVGYNHDYTAFIPRSSNRNDGFLWINHEYVSFPFLDFSPGTPGDLAGFQESYPLVIGDSSLTDRNIQSMGEMLYNLGGSILRISRRRRRDRRMPGA